MNKVEDSEYGKVKNIINARIKNPKEIYKMRYEYLKQKKQEKQKCIICGEKPSYVSGWLWLKKYYCEKHKEQKNE